MNKILENKYPYLTNFFKTSIQQNKLFHSIILYGSNNLIQYAVALELARQLNCLQDGSDDCQCQNCKWIRENQHPSIRTFSKIDNKKDTSKTVISKQQVDEMLEGLATSSEYHRVFILCDADLKELSEAEKLEYQEFDSIGFKPAQLGTETKKWYPMGINYKCFSDVVANAMLKTIEEPPSNTTFIFLTNNKDDLIQTIVSRSQAYFVPDAKMTEYETGFFARFFENYPSFDKNKALDFALFLLKYQDENKLESKYILDCIQYYLVELAKNNSNNKILFSIIKKDIEKVENAKKMLQSHIDKTPIFEDLAFYFVQR